MTIPAHFWRVVRAYFPQNMATHHYNRQKEIITRTIIGIAVARSTVVRPMQKSIGKLEIRPPTPLNRNLENIILKLSYVIMSAR